MWGDMPGCLCGAIRRGDFYTNRWCVECGAFNNGLMIEVVEPDLMRRIVENNPVEVFSMRIPKKLNNKCS